MPDNTSSNLSASLRIFTQAELDYLRGLAFDANQAMARHREFTEFLRRQHEAPEQDGWQLGARGFEMMPREAAGGGAGNPLGSAPRAAGQNGVVDEEERLSIPL